MEKPCLLFTYSELPVLDVRKLHSYQKQHLKNSAHIQANELIQRRNEMPARPASLNLIATDQKETLEVGQWIASKGYHISEVKIEAELLEFIAANPQHLAKGTSQKTLWTPSSLIKEFLTLVDSTPTNLYKKALDIGSGGGRDAVFLAKNNWQVSAIEQKEKVLSKAKQLAERNNQRITWLCCNLNQPNCLPDNQQFDLIIVIRYLNRNLFKWIKTHLRPGGYIVFQAFAEGVQEFGSPKNTNFIIQPAEFSEIFTDFKVIVDRIEKLSDGRPLASFIAQSKL